MIAIAQVADKNGLITMIQLTDHWYETGNDWSLRDGYIGMLKHSSGSYERIPGSFLYLYGHDDDGSKIRAVRLDIKPLKYPFREGYKDTGRIYKEAALKAAEGDLEYEIISVW